MTSSTLPSDPAPRRPRLPAEWLAAGLITPVVIVSLALAALGRPMPHVLAPEARELETRLGVHAESGDPDVIVVGNSKADTDIDPAAFAKELGVGRATPLPVYASNAATWYAVLENRVYARGFEPKVVVIYAAMRYMLDTSPGNEVNRQRLEAQMGEHEPVIEQKMFGSAAASPFWDSVRKRKTAMRTTVVDAVKYRLGGLFYGGPGVDYYARGEAALRPALDKEFGANADFLKTDRTRVVPIAEQQKVDEQRQVTDPTATFLPDLVDLVRAHHGRIVIVRAPIPASSLDVDTVALDVERAVVTYLNERTAGWLDLSDYILPEDHFRDSVHMNERGRALLTKRLAAELKDMGALDPDGTFAPARLPMPKPTLTRTGTPRVTLTGDAKRGNAGCGYVIGTRPYAFLGDPALVTLGAGAVSPLRIAEDGVLLKPFGTREQFADTCAGASINFGNEMRFSATDSFEAEHAYTLTLAPDVTLPTQRGEDVAWVYPGTALHMTVPERWDPARGPLRAVVEARVIPAAGPRDPGWTPPAISVNGSGFAPFEPVGPQGRYWRAVLPEGVDASTIDLSIESAYDWVVVERAWLGPDEKRQWLFGDGTLPTPLRFFENKPVYTPDPPAVVAQVATGPGGVVDLPLPQFPFLEIDAVRERLGVPDCAPLRPMLDGKYLPVAYHRDTGDWRAWDTPLTFAKGILHFEGGGPAMPARTYDIAPVPQRRCEAGWWLYPGEHLEARADALKLGTLRYGATRLVLSGVAFPADTDAAVHVKLLVKGQPVIDEDLPLRELLDAEGKQAPKSWVLPQPLPARMSDVLSVWDLPPGVFLMMNYVSLEEVEADLPAVGDAGAKAAGDGAKPPPQPAPK